VHASVLFKLYSVCILPSGAFGLKPNYHTYLHERERISLPNFDIKSVGVGLYVCQAKRRTFVRSIQPWTVTSFRACSAP